MIAVKMEKKGVMERKQKMMPGCCCKEFNVLI